MLLASGANFGMRRSVPHMLGIGLGFGFMILLVGLGLAQVFERLPVAHTALKVSSVLYLLYLAWKIANASAPGDAGETARPFTFLQAAAFQWVNPKAWAMALTAISAYTPDQSLPGIVLVCAVFVAVNVPAIATWAFMGVKIRDVLSSPKRLTLFNWTMAGLLVASLLPILFP